MPGKKAQVRILAHASKGGAQGATVPPPTVSARWLFTAIAFVALAAAVCAWGALCLLFWQGSWQLLYRPAAAVTRTPASAGIAFDALGFAATETGQPRLQGWWIPAAPDARFAKITILYLHGASGNLGDTVDALARLHGVGANVFAFDYRGYGHSQFAHPSEARWRQDAQWALEYLIGTRHLDAHTIVLYGDGLGADLALEVAAQHPELAGVVLERPIANPASIVFNDPRAHFVPAHLLVKDRYDNDAAAVRLRIPSLWLLQPSDVDEAWGRASGPSTMRRLQEEWSADQQISLELSYWLAHLRSPSLPSIKNGASD